MYRLKFTKVQSRLVDIIFSKFKPEPKLNFCNVLQLSLDYLQISKYGSCSVFQVLQLWYMDFW